MDAEAQTLYNNSVRQFNEMDAKKQAEMITLVKAKLKSHYDSIKAIGIGSAMCYVEAGEKFIEKFGGTK